MMTEGAPFPGAVTLGSVNTMLWQLSRTAEVYNSDAKRQLHGGVVMDAAKPRQSKQA